MSYLTGQRPRAPGKLHGCVGFLDASSEPYSFPSLVCACMCAGVHRCVLMCACVCICACMCVLSVHVCAYVFVCVCLCVHVCLHVCAYVCMCVHVCAHMCNCVYMCVHMCVCPRWPLPQASPYSRVREVNSVSWWEIHQTLRWSEKKLECFQFCIFHALLPTRPLWIFFSPFYYFKNILIEP